MTLDGTNTWVLRAPGADECVVVDPGPLDEAHLAAVAEAARARAVTVITTHAHLDHTEGVERFLRICPRARVWDVRAAGGALADPPDPAGTGVEITVVDTPGHTADSVTLLASASASAGAGAGAGVERAALTGDTILGRGTTVVAHPDGDLGDYLDSLRRLREVGAVPVLPGHGPALDSCAAAAQHYLAHRLARLEQVRAAREAGARSAADVVRGVYAGVDPALWPAAEWSVRAQLAYLDKSS
jgi:glyoxylase-like metal-dependent hydrolase (beta-lactamase superfamily II)